MPRVLLVTNDFPPTIGGIQSYLRDFVDTLDPSQVVVLCSTQDAQAAQLYDASVPYTVIRLPQRVLLPTPGTRRAMCEAITRHNIDVVWFGAAAPLALLAPAARKAGARKIVASTHGHEVGWAMLPGARQVLRGIGKHVDVLTYISYYTLGRLRGAFGSGPRWAHLPSGVSLEQFRPGGDVAAAREYFGLDPARPVVVCISRFVPRKGQDQLLRVMPELTQRHPGVQLLLVGRGRYRTTLEQLAQRYFPGTVFYEAAGSAELHRALTAADVFAMPARTRGGGLDVEGLGIVYLEAQAAGVAVVAGDSGGAPETVTPETGVVVSGTDERQLLAALDMLLRDPQLRQRMGAAGRAHVEQQWTWGIMGQRLRDILA
ncbi:glycosyltransferase family 4 protein [Corynebacterium lizhenjunii]|uniref:Glycosyltransferase family 4 protein n=1 Tax=Corynebacterium lizhenjunii TaxID=2709394 RepID=A0A7T0P992_9CORY|nr:glycosyltransferase family 4 protein [Corynebacterium lizhenjunii]QPK78523.1 glycosyltransferase family 4 protein [Corynebacterium lizhenjunii]